jgi:peroxygenase
VSLPHCHRFVPDKFEALFSKYDKSGKGGLDYSDIKALANGNMNVMDPIGW